MDVIHTNMTEENVSFQERRVNEDFHEDLKLFNACVTSAEYKVFSTVILSVLVIVIFFGNGLTIISYFKFSGLRGIMYTLVLNLAVADIVLGLDMITYPLAEIFTQLAENKYFCAARFGIIIMTFGITVWLHVLLSLDRLFAIKYPMKHLVYSKNRRLLWILVAGIWMLNIGAAVAMVSTSEYINEDKQHIGDHFVCTNGAIVDDQTNFIVCVTLLFVFFFDLIIYAIIIRIILTSGRLQRQNGTHFNIGKLNIVIVIYCLLLVCWGPFVGVNIVMMVYSDGYRLWCVREWTVLLCCVNYATNWVVYGAISKKFKHAFKTILRLKRGEESMILTSNGSG